MTYSNERLTQIFDKTSGKCHICCRRLAFCNYAIAGARGAWEVEHSRARALGGSNHLNNLYPAHISCNRSKQIAATRAVRAQHGRTRAPFSMSQRQTRRIENAVGGGMVGAMVGGLIAGPIGLILGATVGADHNYRKDPDHE